MDHREPVNDWLTDWDDLTRNGLRIRSRSGARSAQPPARSRTPTAVAARTCRPLRRHPRDRLRPRAFSRVRSWCATPSRPRRRRTPDYVRSAEASAARMVLLPPFTPRRSTAAPQGARDMQRVDRRLRRQARLRRGGRVRPAHQGTRRRCHARHPRKRWRQFRTNIDDILEAGTTDEAVLQRRRRDHRLFPRPLGGAARGPRRRPHQLPHECQVPDGQPFKDNHVLGSLRCPGRRYRHTWSGIGVVDSLASRADAGRPRTAGAQAGPDSDSDRDSACSLAGHDGAVGRKEATVNGATSRKARW